MKKFIKLSLFSIVVLGGLALAICYMVIPQETKCAMDIVIGYLNTPLGIAGGTTITLGLVVYVLVKAYGVYVINKSKEQLDEYIKKVEELKDNAIDYEKQAQDHYNDIKELVDNEKARNEFLLESIEKLCEITPNKKVKDFGKAIHERYEKYGREETTND